EYKETHYVQKSGIQALVTCAMNGEEQTVHASGNGRLDAVSNAVKKFLDLEYTIKTYTEHALTVSSKSDAVSYVGIEMADGKVYWGVGQKQDITDSSVYALFSAINRYFAENQK
ncbi:MAG: 2-isopropylmalate synthase, partial [Oscillospiraceae bacterium]|nr:2-isopropylmalate synthase [Oscillospiraceae bacterium]